MKDQDAFEETSVFIECVPASVRHSKLSSRDLPRTNKAIFGPGLVATTGESCLVKVSCALLTNALGDHHKRQRKIVSPVFAVGQLRRLTPVFYEIADKVSCLDQRTHLSI